MNRQNDLSRRAFVRGAAATAAATVIGTAVLTGTDALAATSVSASIAGGADVQPGETMTLTVRSAGHRSLSIHDSSGATWAKVSDDGTTATYRRTA